MPDNPKGGQNLGQGDSSSKGAPTDDKAKAGDGSRTASEEKGSPSGTTSGHQEKSGGGGRSDK